MIAQVQAAPIYSEETHRLRNKITDIDALSQEGFSEIAAIARRALKELESISVDARSGHTITQTLVAIEEKAMGIQDCISFEAGAVGCGLARSAG